MNQVWQYNITSNQWRFMKGSTQTTSQPVFGKLLHPDPLSDPGRNGNMATITSTGDIYVIGSKSAAMWVLLNDPCGTDISPCSVNANCKDSWGGTECTCKEGYLGDGYGCTLISPPLSPTGTPGNEPSGSGPIASPKTAVSSGQINSYSPFFVLLLSLWLFKK